MRRRKKDLKGRDRHSVTFVFLAPGLRYTFKANYLAL
jgi:hypothetical protein